MITATEHKLPFSELSKDQLEELWLALLAAEGHTGINHWGAAGNEGGCDIVSTDRDGRRWVTQAKRTKDLYPKQAAAELRKVLSNPPDPEPEVYLLAAACALSRQTKEKLEQEIAHEGKRWEVKCWGHSVLDLKVRAHDRVKCRFFGTPPPSSEPPPRIPPIDPKAILKAWCHHVETTHANLTEAFHRPGAPQLLDHIYVELRMMARDLAEGEAYLERVEKLDAGGRLNLREVLEREPTGGRWLLYGEPGSGKTTLLRHLAAELAKEESPRWIPVFGSLPRLARAEGWFLDTICAHLKVTSINPATVCATLDGLGEEGRLLLLFDGLDEVPKDHKEQIDALLGDCFQRWPGSPIVVTSRPIGGHPIGADFQELELLPFAADDRREFLTGWLGDASRAARAFEAMRRDASVWTLSGNPLYLTLLAMLVAEEVKIPERRSELYDRIFTYLLGGRHRPGERSIPRAKLVRGVLRQLADAMTEENLDAEPVEDLEERLWHSADLKAELDKVTRWRDEPRVFLDDVAKKTSLLGPHDGLTEDWRYWHRTFREALAAEALHEAWKQKGDGALLARAGEIAGDLGRWAEPYALLVGQAASPDALVKKLMEINRPLGLRALATAQGLKEQTIDDLLGLTQKWQERVQVFKEIPDLLGDAESTLRLIDRLRRRTRDVHDLFFLEESVKLVGAAWPDAAAAVAEARGRFFADWAAPPEELFTTVETPLDGPLDLWREIAAGAFKMGSPDDELAYDEKKHPLGAFGSERPQHEVEISRSFRLMAVPVTNAMYQAFDASHGSHRWKGVRAAELAHHPVVNVDWYEAVAFCRWLRRHGVAGARLPTEAEWEYACRAGMSTRFWSGDSENDVRRVGWYRANAEIRTHRVGEKPANPWGLYDVHGNVWEWCADGWDAAAYAKRAPRAVDPRTSEDPWNTSAHRVVRGGSWASPAQALRAGARYRNWRRNRVWSLGFRVFGSGPEHA